MAMALQAAASLIDLAGVAAVAAVLFTLVALWWALAAQEGPLMPAKKLKPEPHDADIARPIPEVEPTDADLGVSLEAFQTSTECQCDLLGLCDSAVDGQVLQNLEEDFGGQTLLEDQVDSEAAPLRRRPPSPGQLLRGAPAAEAPLSLDEDLGIDFEAFQARVGRHCDLVLDALCESTVDDQSAKVIDDLERELAGTPVGAPAERALLGVRPGLGLEAFQANVEQHCDQALESMCNHAIDDQCTTVLKIIEDESGGSSVLEEEMRAYTFSAREIEEAISRQVAELSVLETRAVGMDGAFEVAVEEHNQRLLGELASASQQQHCVNSLEMIIERLRKAGEFLLWVI